MTLQYSLVGSGENQTITVFVPGADPLVAGVDHSNFEKIVAGARAGIDNITDLFDVSVAVERNFKRLSDRVTVKYGQVYLDGDPVDGTLQEQIIEFVREGEDFGPLVAFYEKLLNNPLGDVREGLYDWIKGQRREGALTITSDGDLIGYKSVVPRSPEWRDDHETVYVPSRRGEGIVNGRDVSEDEFIEQVTGDVVEMPRSRVLHAPSQACGDGLHIGTWTYAKTFYGGSTVMLVKFSPRDIVSLPDSNSEWKLRVCRYTVLDIGVTEPLSTPVYDVQEAIQERLADLEEEAQSISDDVDAIATQERVALYLSGEEARVGDTINDSRYGHGEITQVFTGLFSDPTVSVKVLWAGEGILTPADGPLGHHTRDMVLVSRSDAFRIGDQVTDSHGDAGTVTDVSDDGRPTIDYGGALGVLTPSEHGYPNDRLTRTHGKGGPTSQAAKGNGKNPAQDDKGRFVNGRPGSQRDSKTGRFA